mmetsp:Transcript_20289/g.67693  ORF Transcript_20289/g.67693 Transcript_20289/m.67693 type:complete len:120 (-) Transcript_20289:1552-1911(-)
MSVEGKKGRGTRSLGATGEWRTEKQEEHDKQPSLLRRERGLKHRSKLPLTSSSEVGSNSRRTISSGVFVLLLSLHIVPLLQFILQSLNVLLLNLVMELNRPRARSTSSPANDVSCRFAE